MPKRSLHLTAAAASLVILDPDSPAEAQRWASPRKTSRRNDWFAGELAYLREANKPGLTQFPDQHKITAIEPNRDSE